MGSHKKQLPKAFLMSTHDICFQRENRKNVYRKCPNILYISDKIAYADSADPDQTAPSGAI